MTKMTKIAHLLPLSLLLFGGAAHASDPVGVYAVVKKVAYEGDPNAPSAVRICGAFALSNINNGGYFNAASGYLYYNCRTGEEAMCRMQWKEIAATADKSCVAFGARRQNGGTENKNGTVRTALPPQNPDPYPIALGVVAMPMTAEGPTQCQALAKVAVTPTACEVPAMVDMRAPGDTPDLADPAPAADLRPVTPPPPPGGCTFVTGATGAAGSAGAGALPAAALVFGLAGFLLRRRAGRRR